MTEPKPCLRQQDLIGAVQQHLLRLAELARADADAVKIADLELALKIDKQIEEELGSKERAMGALKQHREEHGC